MREQMKRGDKLYFARTHPSLGVYELLDLIVRTIEDSWFSAFEKKTGRAYLFSYNDIGSIIFTNRFEALKVVKEIEAKLPKKTFTKEVED